MATAMSMPELYIGKRVTLAPGLVCLRLPLALGIDHINVYAIEEEAGWTLIDTGLYNTETIALWEALFEQALDSRPIVRIVVTHSHADHVGMAGWLAQKFNAPLWMSNQEYKSCQTQLGMTQESVRKQVAFIQHAGWSYTTQSSVMSFYLKSATTISPLPPLAQTLSDGQYIQIGAYQWQVLIGLGHSPEHVCLYCKKLNMLLAGDQILPDINANVAVLADSPKANPMLDWFKSMEYLHLHVPNSAWVLPSHGMPYQGPQSRIEQQVGSRLKALSRLTQALDRPKTLVELFPALFKKPIDANKLSQKVMATGEACAYMNYLLAQNPHRFCYEKRGAVGWYWQVEPTSIENACI